MEPIRPQTPPNPIPDHITSHEIRTKYKETIRQLHFIGKKKSVEIAYIYRLWPSTVNKILKYDTPERSRPSRDDAPRKLTDIMMFFIIE